MAEFKIERRKCKMAFKTKMLALKADDENLSNESDEDLTILKVNEIEAAAAPDPVIKGKLGEGDDDVISFNLHERDTPVAQLLRYVVDQGYK